MLPAGGWKLVAKTGDGKTTMTVALVLHACAGIDYLGLSFRDRSEVLVVEDEGPREAFREKLAARLERWEHGGEPRIWDVPAEWGQVRIRPRRSVNGCAKQSSGTRSTSSSQTA